MTDLFDTARHHTPGLATERLRRTPQGVKGRVFTYVIACRERGATHFEVRAHIGGSDAEASRPLSDLVRDGFLVRLEETRPGPNGNEATVVVAPQYVHTRAVARKEPRHG